MNCSNPLSFFQRFDITPPNQCVHFSHVPSCTIMYLYRSLSPHSCQALQSEVGELLQYKTQATWQRPSPHGAEWFISLVLDVVRKTAKGLCHSHGMSIKDRFSSQKVPKMYAPAITMPNPATKTCTILQPVGLDDMTMCRLVGGQGATSWFCVACASERTDVQIRSKHLPRVTDETYVMMKT